jgi:hypothetical protein
MSLALGENVVNKICLNKKKTCRETLSHSKKDRGLNFTG